MYGYHWWGLSENLTEDYPGAEVIYYALGYGSQHIMIIPSINMVIVSTSANYEGQSGAVFNM